MSLWSHAARCCLVLMYSDTGSGDLASFNRQVFNVFVLSSDQASRNAIFFLNSI